MKEIVSSIGESIFSKLYLILFSLINFLYVFFEVLKSIYIEKNSLGITIEEQDFEYLLSISKFVSFLEVVLISIFLIYLVFTFIKRDKLTTKNFIVINFALFIGLFFINSIISFVFSAPGGNLSQQLIIPFLLTLILSIYFVLSTLYKRKINFIK